MKAKLFLDIFNFTTKFVRRQQYFIGKTLHVIYYDEISCFKTTF